MATIVAALVNIGLNFILIPTFQQNAAAFTTVIAELLSMVITWWFGRKYFRVSFRENDVDCSCCTFYHFSSESIKEGNPQEFIKSSTQAIEVLMWEHWYTTVIWNKLFKRNAIMKNGNIVEFQKGRTVGEDEKWLIDVIIGNNLSVKFFNEKLYHWRIRENSALHSNKDVITGQMIDEVKTKEEILNMFSHDKKSNIYKLAAKSLFDKASIVCKFAYVNKDNNALKFYHSKLKYGKFLWFSDNFKNNRYLAIRRLYWQLKIDIKCLFI